MQKGVAVAEFDGLVAIVTGGASGIRLHTARLLSARGAQVACLDLHIESVSAPLLGVIADVTNDASVRAAVEQVATTFGGIDIVVNNAGIGAQGNVADNDDDEWRRCLDVNVVGAVRVSRAALPYLRASSHAAIAADIRRLATGISPEI